MKKSLIITATLAALLAACSSTPTAPVEDRSAAQSAPKSDLQTKEVPKANIDPFKEAGALDKIPLLQKRSIYFEYDKYDISLDYVTIIEAHSKYLKANPAAKVLIQGNADERGSREYNLALGQKRAEAVASNLKLLGVKADAVEAVSLGEEKPKATGHDEASWAENRRADLVYGAK
ncbi:MULTISPECIES: peptidoglycan-associated lipoprotein Pal [Uliginosibacterium]|uniref:Peptidoglycan-associated lipoprotein n=1 Tax=Uliginosibacterium aquaticum TaxID=2731212 RepID=A0ABX2IN75_9RHOO|nr:MULTISPECIES: peptidoglycan-associated lipoprotein Pal [Uliginosibacterium]NSL55733.1 peptidoglycan-associated lipoprotein Pal [Uliginosibacterium aquaticum]PLK50508.1 peptidoglycan-associated lipoprotein [Uliginosibacterium sp. TH139]